MHSKPPVLTLILVLVFFAIHCSYGEYSQTPPHHLGQQDCVRLFEQMYQSKKFFGLLGGGYECNYCHKSIKRLLRHLKQSNEFSIEKASVLVIFKEDHSAMTLEEFNTERWRFPLPLWNYHVVLEHKGMIYDLSGANPGIYPAKEYFQNAYRTSKLKIRVVSADRYEAESWPDLFTLSTPDFNYPFVPLKEYLEPTKQ